ncbi:MAG: hypothetical protein A2857_05495 [Candidatus Levybacteria bacterium RIFCSPHIGHO2_01_FULL_36_15]|nr:MAG: hypothetical protein A2857_05495 [Candidatus Levybacteria bacterium RIFCSPHIGHO2_01_FULL_36_15]OGH38498.1 MAG: hypothetical protein A2905_02020 [Candidatus Levybacteria bacterium RIFCSPLOWO2_01_FULL_36_10]
MALLLAISQTPKTYAAEKLAGSSAALLTNNLNGAQNSDKRVVALQNVFKKYNSPLTPYAQYYVKYADKYKVDWKLLPSISGLESYFGNLLISGTYNAYGWGGGYIYFKNWEDGIDTINKALKENYIEKGADTVDKIGPIYAEASHWSTAVKRYMNQINDEYIDLTSKDLSRDL